MVYTPDNFSINPGFCDIDLSCSSRNNQFDPNVHISCGYTYWNTNGPLPSGKPKSYTNYPKVSNLLSDWVLNEITLKQFARQIQTPEEIAGFILASRGGDKIYVLPKDCSECELTPIARKKFKKLETFAQVIKVLNLIEPNSVLGKELMKKAKKLAQLRGQKRMLTVFKNRNLI